MAYSVSRRAAVREELFLKDEQGNIVKNLTIDVDADQVAKHVSREHLNLIHAYERIKSLKEGMDREGAARNDMEQGSPVRNDADRKSPARAVRYDKELKAALDEAGRASYALYETLFGEENAKAILEFYGGRLIEMNLEITPFITHVMIPKIREAVTERKREAAGRYGAGKNSPGKNSRDKNGAAKRHGAPERHLPPSGGR